MFTLQNPRHETFALSLAQGATPEAAYRAAGFSDRNRKTRSHELAADPDIVARVDHLRSCLPHIEGLRDRFAPSVLLIPETIDEMKAWLWQVMNGTRKVLPIQLRAATLFCRLNGWHLHRSSSPQAVAPVPATKEPANPADQSEPSQSRAQPETPAAPRPIQPSDGERQLLANLNKHTLANDLAHRPLYPSETRPFYSTMADLALLNSSSSEQDKGFSTLLPEPADAVSPNGDKNESRVLRSSKNEEGHVLRSSKSEEGHVLRSSKSEEGTNGDKNKNGDKHRTATPIKPQPWPTSQKRHLRQRATAMA